MGKRRGHGGGGGATRPSASSGESLVVVNPTMLQTAARGGPKASQKGRKKVKSQQSKKPRRSVDDVSSLRPKRDRKQRGGASVVCNVAVSSAARLSRSEGGTASVSVLRVKREQELLAGAYWVLLSRRTSRGCVVALPNHLDTSPSQFASALKHLGLQAMALHRKMTVGQRAESVQRLASSSKTATSTHSMVLVTTDHLLASAASLDVDVVLVGAESPIATVTETATAKFAHVYYVTSAAAGMDGQASNWNTFRPELKGACVQQLQARLKLAQQIVDIVQRLVHAGAAAQDGEDKWARKLAKGADLEDEDDGGQQKKKRKRAMSPDEQRLQALTEKLYVLLARKVTEKQTASNTESIEEPNGQHRREKLEVLGLVTVNAAVGTAMTDERSSAQTQWMDCAVGQAHGGQWEGTVRHGASKDAASLALRERFCTAQTQQNSTFLSQWTPNKQPVDVDKWGGAFGKACGHNEVVMHSLRPFFPQEVLNSKVCSKLFPAPGNQSFDGCLEHLRLACAAQGTSMTLWDAEFFVFLSSSGHVTWTKKSQLLSLSLASLQCLVPALRGWTAACHGRLPPSAVLRAIQLCCQVGSSDKRSADQRLPPKALKRIVSFAFGGSARLWRQIAKLAVPLEEEAVYGSLD